MTVIDSHFHWYPRSLFDALCEQPGYPRARRVGDSFAYILGEAAVPDEGRRRGDRALPDEWLDLERGLDLMSTTYGGDFAVVCTTGVLSGLLGQVPATSSADCARVYNEAVAEAQRAHVGNFFGTATVPLHDADEAISVAEEAVKELGLVGINLPALSGDEFVDAPRLEPFFDRVESLQVPLIVHPTDVAYRDSFPGYDDAIFMTIGRLLDSSLTVLRLIFGGVLERHPGLRVLHTHSGALLPYQAGRIDKNARVRDLPLPPSEYLKRIFVDTVSPLELTIRAAIDFYGADHVLYGTDYPCWNVESALSVIEEAGVAEPTKDLVLAGNARSLFNIG